MTAPDAERRPDRHIEATLSTDPERRADPTVAARSDIADSAHALEHANEIRAVLLRTSPPSCPWCGAALDLPEWQACSACVDDYLEGLRRRRHAVLRLPPLPGLLEAS